MGALSQSAERPRDTAPGLGCVAYVSATPQAAGRAVFLSVTVTGTISFTFLDGSIVTGTFPIGIYEFNWSATTMTLGTATATAFNIL